MTVFSTETWKQVQIEQSRRNLVSQLANQQRSDLNQRILEFFQERNIQVSGEEQQ